MFTLQNLTVSANQTSIARLADGSSVILKFLYRAGIQRWTVDVSRLDFVATGIGLATNKNLLRIWRNVIPFGIQVVTADGTDPFLADDLANAPGFPARVTINILDGTNGLTDLTDVESANFS